MIWAENFLMTVVMEHCDENCHGPLCGAGSWSLLVSEAMEICDGRRHGAFDDSGFGAL